MGHAVPPPLSNRVDGHFAGGAVEAERQADVTDYEKMLEDYYNSDFDLAERIQNH